ncbi:MAG: FtsX-like permease family protein [bacterium]|jgi:ABC-type lipoprotein release transport system permease subunit
MSNKVQHAKVQLPISRAYRIAIQSIRVRFFRSIITAIGIVLGIAFYVSVQTTRMLMVVDRNDPSMIETEARLKWLVWASLLMCLVGITNAMLMSVTERYKEIGTMKCLGATDSFIVKIFLIESCLMGVIASTTGAALGFVLIILVRALGDGWKVLNQLTLHGVGMVIGSALAIGIVLTVIAAIAPAIRAARMPAAAALRVEI